jgi:hypothetical protein
MPTHPARSIALVWFALVAVGMIALVGAVTLTAETALTPSPTPFPTLTRTASLTFTPSPGGPTPTMPTRTPTRRATLGPTPTASATPAYPQCAWQWARQPLPEITEQAQAFFDEADFNSSVWAEAYGENCVDYRSGTPTLGYFAAMTTDFYLSINLPNLTDARAVATSYRTAYDLLVAFSAEADLPARLGYLDITYGSPGYYISVRAMFSEIEASLDAGLTGQALLEALGSWPVTPVPLST